MIRRNSAAIRSVDRIARRASCNCIMNAKMATWPGGALLSGFVQTRWSTPSGNLHSCKGSMQCKEGWHHEIRLKRTRSEDIACREMEFFRVSSRRDRTPQAGRGDSVDPNPLDDRSYVTSMGESKDFLTPLLERHHFQLFLLP